VQAGTLLSLTRLRLWPQEVVAAEYAGASKSRGDRKNILACAATGERDPIELRLAALIKLKVTVAA